MLDQRKMPIVEAIKKYEDQQSIRLHVPGHKGKAKGSFLDRIFPYDVTEIPGLDDLHHPQEAIDQSQRLAAEVFQADHTFFLIGGSTVGNIAMLLASTQPGDSILVQRNVHKSVINGMILARVKPVYLPPTFDHETGLALSVSLDQFKEMALEYNVKVAFLSNPNYFGMTIDLKPYAIFCRQHDIALLVDEAHGAHFGQTDSVPPSAMQAGVTAAVQSTHKMLPSLTMSSMLHIQGQLIDLQRIRQALIMVQSSSPSYPLMASLDYARHYVHDQGKADIARSLPLIQQFYLDFNAACIPGLELVTLTESFTWLDPFKITLRTLDSTFNGFSLMAYLERNGIYPELADEQHTLLVLSLFVEADELNVLLDVLMNIKATVGSKTSHSVPYTYSREVVLMPSEAFYAEKERISFKQAAGRVSGDMITPYPPGVPTINPGERIDHATMDYVARLKQLGCRFHDISDSSLDTILVIK